MIWIDSNDALDPVLARVEKFDTIAVDTEADSLHSYFDKVCLVQMSTPDEDFLIDPLARVDLRKLKPVLSDRAITKIFHGADYDLRILDRDFGITISNIVDTMVCAQLLGIESFGLAALLKRYFDVDLDKTHQRSDWSMRPLPPEMLRYAATDTHYLIALATKMRAELQALGRWEWALEEFERLETIRYREKEEDEVSFRKLKGIAKFDRRQLGIIEALYNWRDALARKADRPPFKILGNETLLSIAEQKPTRVEDLQRIRGVSGYVMQRYGRDLLAMVETVLASPDEKLPDRVAGKPWLRDRDIERKVDRLKRARDVIASDLKIDSAVLAPRHLLMAVATANPTTAEALEQLPSLRKWQRQLLGPSFLAVLNEAGRTNA